MSLNDTDRNVTLGQSPTEQQRYVAMARTTSSDATGGPQLFSPDNSLTTNLTHVVFTRSGGGTRSLYVDGALLASDSNTGTFASWNGAANLALGNEFDQDRHWLGTYHLVAIYDRALPLEEVQMHFNLGATMPQQPPDPLVQLLSNTPFRLILAEHPSGDFSVPAWDDAARSLTVYLPKAEDLRRPISTYMHPDHLKLMGVWAWIREYIDHQTLLYLSNPSLLEYLTRQVVDCVQYALEGGHWMLTSSRKIAFVHAVQQPIGQPHIILMLASRQAGDTSTQFAAITQVHGKSTLTLNLLAKWTEPVDDLSNSGPTQKSAQEAVEEVNIKSLVGGSLPGSKAGPGGFPKAVAYYQPPQDWVIFSMALSPVHEFGDTKHRNISYRMVAGSRFREYFAPDVPGGFTRDTNEIVVDVPSSARPAVPRLRYMVPTYGWKREATTNIIGSYRQGGGLRVYLERPWFASGEGELLGVILWQGSTLKNEQRHALKRHITQWGIDPIHVSENIAPLPQAGNFPNRVNTRQNLILPELASIDVGAGNNPVTVVGFPVHYNEARGLWFCDIEMEAYTDKGPYSPFVRLALVRYQPSSVAGMHVSQVVLADFAQLAPDRSAILTWDPYDEDLLHLVVSGYTYRQSADYVGNPINDGSDFSISVQVRDPDLVDDLAWSPVYAAVTAQQTQNSENVLWRGSIQMPSDRQPGQYRVVIAEYEHILNASGVRQGRLVYADTVEV